jgi:hypothetical protein
MVDSKSTVITTSLSEKSMHSVGLEPTSTNTLELESSPLDRSGTNACTSNSVLTLSKSSFHAAAQVATKTDTIMSW